ncbi:response regulator, partial [Roseateles sp. DC23W]
LPRPRRLLLAEAPGASRTATLNLLLHLGLGETLTVCDDVATLLLALDEARTNATAAEWLLLDWRLPGPGPSGAELLARLRREHPSLRIAVLGQPAPGEGPAQARAFGARAVCDKPLQPAELRRLLDDAPAPAPAVVDGESLTGLRVLLVEDHPVNQDIAVRLLSSRGALVDVAANGQLGLDQLRARGADAYDLVLMDLRMPVLDGLEATRRLRAMPGFESLPVLAMTAHALAEERAQCLVAGMQGHIAKPLDVAHLVRELQRYRQPGTLGDGPALDLAAGLRQFSGQSALYHRTLRGFADQYAQGLASWVDWLRRGDWSELRRAAHTLQGLAATLGAQPLHRAALALERCAATGDMAGAGHLLSRVEAALLTVRDEIRGALSPRDESLPAPAAGAVPTDLAELRLLLNQSDSSALDWWELHGAHTGLQAATRRRVEAALAVMDFDGAARALGDAT